MAISAVWKGGGNVLPSDSHVHAGYLITANSFGDYYGDSTTMVGITKLADMSYRKFSYNAGYSQTGLHICTQDGDAWILYGGTTKPGLRVNPATGDILQIITHSIPWNLRFQTTAAGREWSFMKSTVVGWKPGSSDVTFSVGAVNPLASYINPADPTDVYLWFAGSVGMKRINLSSAVVISTWSNPFPGKGFSPDDAYGSPGFAVISGTAYWVQNNRLIVWPLGSDPYLISTSGTISFSFPQVSPAGMLYEISASVVRTTNPATGAQTTETITGRPSNRIVYGAPAITIGSETWYPTSGTGTPTF